MSPLLAEFPQSRVLDRARFRLAEWNFEAADYAAAADGYRWVVEQAASSPLADP